MLKRDSIERAEILVKETSLPAQEIAKMTGIDVYQVFGMKLNTRAYLVLFPPNVAIVGAKIRK